MKKESGTQTNHVKRGALHKALYEGWEGDKQGMAVQDDATGKWRWQTSINCTQPPSSATTSMPQISSTAPTMQPVHVFPTGTLQFSYPSLSRPDEIQYAHNSTAGMLARDMRPVHTLRGEGYRYHIRHLRPNYTIPCAKTMVTTLLAMKMKRQRQLKAEVMAGMAKTSRRTLAFPYGMELPYLPQELRLNPVLEHQARFSSYSGDLWSCRKAVSYMSLTSQSIDANDFILNNHTLYFKQFKDRHTAEKIADGLRSFHGEYDLPLDKPSPFEAFVIDGGADINKAARIYGSDHGHARPGRRGRQPSSANRKDNCCTHGIQRAIVTAVDKTSIPQAQAAPPGFRLTKPVKSLIKKSNNFIKKTRYGIG